MAQINNPLSRKSMEKIFQAGDGQELVKQAEQLGRKFGKRRGSDTAVSTNQIRAIFGTVRQIEMNWPLKAPADKQERAQRSLRLLQPKIVYRAARERRSNEFQQFAGLMVEAIDLVLADKNAVRRRFGYLVDFFEALMAYHKAAGERVLSKGG